jgi:hypothetical protein
LASVWKTVEMRNVWDNNPEISQGIRIFSGGLSGGK